MDSLLTKSDDSWLSSSTSPNFSSDPSDTGTDYKIEEADSFLITGFLFVALL